MCVIVVLLSENDWKTNQKAVLCALQTYDVYQQEHDVKYIQHKSLTSVLNASSSGNSVPAKDGQTSTAPEVMLCCCVIPVPCNNLSTV